MEETPHLKLLTIGDSQVGKSLLLLRWSTDNNKPIKPQSMPTIGIDFKMKNIEIDGKRVKIQIWDTAGQERFRTITTSYYRNSQGVLLVYDITQKETFVSIRNWMAQIQLHADANINKVLIGNKCDLLSKRVVTHEEGESLAREYKIPFFETSALSNINVDEAFMTLSKTVYERLKSGPPSSSSGKPTNNNKPKISSQAIGSEDFADKPKKKSWC
mmetsp:Transcript_6141/g.5489  ORF Transcript_6141/g.5489 Transcript_6141/m.5489 type:complete len:215 (+) Transcript_6141:176-820(+)